MIEVKDNPEHPGFPVVDVRSNLSISLDRLASVFLGLSAVTLLVAAGPLLFGLWPIMVIALIHLLIVGWCLRLAWRGHWARERLVVGPELLTVEQFALNRHSRRDWPLAWVQVCSEARGLGDVHVYLSCKGQRQQIGAFLPLDERLELVKTLKNCIGPMSAWRNMHQPQVS